MYKGSSWTIGTLLGKKTSDLFYNATVPAYYNSYETWSGYENKYPDFGDGEPIEWKPLYDAVNVSSDYSSDANFTSKVDATYDLPVFLDYYLFIELMLASDNQGKNTYLSVYDQTVSPKLTITPWDLDGVWGRRWDGSSNLTYANQNFETFINRWEHAQNNLYIRLIKLNYNGFNTNLKNRYRQLRGTYFSYSNLYQRFENYSKLFNISGSGNRERARWGIGDINNEMTFVANWITSRLSFLDNQYLGAPYIETGINQMASITFSCSPNPVRDMLTISGLNTGDKIQLISMQGSVLIQTVAGSDQEVINMNSYQSGIYFIKVNNQVTRIIKR